VLKLSTRRFYAIAGHFTISHFTQISSTVTIAATQLLVGIYVPSFATTVLTGIGASCLSLAVLLVAPPLSTLYPYSQVTIGMQARSLATPTPASIAWFLIWNTILMTATVLLSRRALRRKQH